ncbi:MAG: DUF5618 family protein [Candidatus Edwardsbacteria bacterium]
MNRNKSLGKEYGEICSSEAYHQEAIQYYHNAKELLKKSTVKYDRYQNKKFVQEACGTCYLAVLKAIDGYLLSRGVDLSFCPSPNGGGKGGVQWLLKSLE